MAKRKAPELSLEAQAANRAGEAIRRKDKEKRAQNSEKQKRFREGMKAQGFKQVLLWDLPCPADVRERMTAAGFRQIPAWEKVARDKKKKSGAVNVCAAINEASIGAAEKAPEVKKALSHAIAGFFHDLGGEIDTKLSKEADMVYHDFIELLKPLGDPWRDTE